MRTRLGDHEEHKALRERGPLPAGTGSECAECTTDEYACNGAQLRECNATRTGFVDKELCAIAAHCNSNDWSYFIPITPAAKVRLEYFRLRGRVDNAGSCAMALYRDSNDVPGVLLAKSWTSIKVVAGVASVVPDAQVILSAGQKYWIGAGTFSDNPVGDLHTGITYPFSLSVLEIP